MAPRKRTRGAARGRASRRGGRPRGNASPAPSDAGSAVAPPPETPRLVSDSPASPVLPPVLPPALPSARSSLLGRLPRARPASLERLSPLQPVVETPSGRKRPASGQVSVTVALNAFLMRSQLTPTPVAKRTAALPPVLSRAVCLRCSKRIDKASAITKKGKAIAVGAACVKAANRKCEYCAVQHHDCEEVGWSCHNAAETHAKRHSRFLSILSQLSTLFLLRDLPLMISTM
jgi:hypothetical protein